MSQTVSEFVFFRVKPSVKPEDPSSEEGDALMSVFRNIKHYSGHQSSAWGRSAEDPNTIVWVVDWTDARGSVNARQLDRFLAPDNAQPPTALHTTLNPPISSTDTLAKNPVTELCMLGFPSSMPAAETKQLFADLINFRTTLVEQLPQATGPRSWAMGHVDRPSLLQHAKSPSGQAVMHLLAVGWESVEAHKKAKETQEFVQSIAPIREKMLPPVPGLEMKHVSFQKL